MVVERFQFIRYLTSTRIYYVSECLEAELFIDDKTVFGLELIAILYETPINDNYIIEMGTNVDRKQGLRTHQWHSVKKSS